MERQTGGAWGLQEPRGGEEAEREEAGLGATSQMGQDSRRGHRHAPPLPRGQARGLVSLPSSRLGAQELGAPQPAAGWAGGQHLGRKGARVRLCSAARQIQR